MSWFGDRRNRIDPGYPYRRFCPEPAARGTSDECRPWPRDGYGAECERKATDAEGRFDDAS